MVVCEVDPDGDRAFSYQLHDAVADETVMFSEKTWPTPQEAHAAAVKLSEVLLQSLVPGSKVINADEVDFLDVMPIQEIDYRDAR